MKICILVSSCDAYCDLWDIYFSELFHNIDEEFYEVFLVSQTKIYDSELVRTILVGHNSSWSDDIAKALTQIDNEYIIFTLEDFILKDKVDHVGINELLMEAKENYFDYLRLVLRPPPRLLNKSMKYSRLDIREPYAITTQASIWRRSYLISLLVAGESIWEFELNAPLKLSVNDGLYCTNCDIFPYGHHSVERGKWFMYDYFIYSKKGYVIERGRHSLFYTLRWYVLKPFKWVWRKIK
jgi:hypothetical protein